MLHNLDETTLVSCDATRASPAGNLGNEMSSKENGMRRTEGADFQRCTEGRGNDGGGGVRWGWAAPEGGGESRGRGGGVGEGSLFRGSVGKGAPRKAAGPLGGGRKEKELCLSIVMCRLAELAELAEP